MGHEPTFKYIIKYDYDNIEICEIGLNSLLYNLKMKFNNKPIIEFQTINF